MHWTRTFLLTGLVVIPLIALMLFRGMDIGTVGLYLVMLIFLFFMIDAWTRRAIAEYRAGLTLKAVFSAAVVLFFLALLFRIVLVPSISMLLPETSEKTIPANQSQTK